ncbi:IgGFc-binding protein-like, partial [Aplysia californica]|uniref:IgGFc-binding protein-like n=1 Tax=Aplysia californica TaxID=6500 RepID=A0ABM1W204_APLCA
AKGETDVQIRLRLGDPSATVTFDSSSYSDGEVVCVTLDQFNSLQLQSVAVDLTGTNIRSNKPISVLSGGRLTRFMNDFTSDGVIEQMPPLSTWGKDFLAVLSPLASVYVTKFIHML